MFLRKIRNATKTAKEEIETLHQQKVDELLNIKGEIIKNINTAEDLAKHNINSETKKYLENEEKELDSKISKAFKELEKETKQRLIKVAEDEIAKARKEFEFLIEKAEMKAVTKVNSVKKVVEKCEAENKKFLENKIHSLEEELIRMATEGVNAQEIKKIKKDIKSLKYPKVTRKIKQRSFDEMFNDVLKKL